GPKSSAGPASLAGNGWKQLLTTLPPIGDSGPLLGIPFLLGLVAATLGGSLALRCRPSFAPLGAPAALFAAAILLGMPTAPTLLLGAAFVAVALGWASLRHHRTPPPAPPPPTAARRPPPGPRGAGRAGPRRGGAGGRGGGGPPPPGPPPAWSGAPPCPRRSTCSSTPARWRGSASTRRTDRCTT